MTDFLSPLFKFNPLNSLIGIGILLFLALTAVYSLGFMKGRKRLAEYYTYIILSAAASLGVVFTENLMFLLVCWGFLGLTLYLLINMGDNASAAAKKAMIIVGGTDALMILGFGIIYYISGTLRMGDMRIGLDSVLGLSAYICIAIACFAKAGAMPFHSWIPDCSERAPVPVVAFLPASLDKLLGIYLLFKISLNIFAINRALNLSLMLIGTFTIIAAVMMALVQHNMKRLLGYHAVSQVGYMLLGLGTGNPIGIAGGLFHMFNNAIYKSCLFFTSGNVEYRTHTTELNDLGGLAKNMPFTYISAVNSSIAISGIPPFNGFFSKWMIYQGLVDGFTGPRYVGIFCLAAAMFGSGLTLASFMKLLHATYLGRPSPKIEESKPQEAPWVMRLPVIVLSLLCVVLGVFAYNFILSRFIYPVTGVPQAISGQAFSIATISVIAGILAGLAVFYLNGIIKGARRDGYFTGGYDIPLENKVSGVEFYNSISDLAPLKSIYKKAESGVFDIYEQGKNVVFGAGRVLQHLHNGVLPTYLVWILLGMMALFLALMR